MMSSIRSSTIQLLSRIAVPMRRLVLLLSLAVAAAVPAQAPGFSQSERAEGAKLNPELTATFGGAYAGPQAAYVRTVGQRIAAQSGLTARPADYTVTLLNTNVNNAFAIPGGYVYVTRDLVALMNNEAELAFVMGHEVAHVAARHARKREQTSGLAGFGAALLGVITGSSAIANLAGTGAQLYALGYSRDQEREADTLGVRYLARAGYDPQASDEILAALEAQSRLDARLAGRDEKAQTSWLSTHPATEDRVARVRAEASALAARGGAQATNRDAFLNAIDGMMYGDDPAQGVIDGRSFRHAGLGIAFEAPPGFALQNTPSAVLGRKPQGGSFRFAGGKAQGADLFSYGTKVWQAAGARPPEARPTRINGIDAAISQTRVTNRSGTVDATLAVYRWGPDSFYHVLMIAPPGGAAVFEPMVASVRRLTPAESAAIRPRRIAVVPVKPGDTPAGMAARMAYGDDRLARFLVLNGLSANSRLVPGSRVKLIVFG
jgi:predicted Zn-dependent protease